MQCFSIVFKNIGRFSWGFVRQEFFLYDYQVAKHMINLVLKYHKKCDSRLLTSHSFFFFLVVLLASNIRLEIKSCPFISTYRKCRGEKLSSIISKHCSKKCVLSNFLLYPWKPSKSTIFIWSSAFVEEWDIKVHMNYPGLHYCQFGNRLQRKSVLGKRKEARACP